MVFTNWLKKELINYDIRRYPVAVIIILCQNNIPRKKVGPYNISAYLHKITPRGQTKQVAYIYFFSFLSLYCLLLSAHL